MACDCCDNLRCVPNPVQSLTVSPATSDGATVSWQAPVRDPGTEEVEYYILSVEDMDGNELAYLNIDADQTSHTFEDELFIRDDVNYRIIVHAMYPSCIGTTQINGELSTCNSSDFMAKHENTAPDKNSIFLAGSTDVGIDTNRFVYVNCSGVITLNLAIPCLEHYKGELYVNDVLVFYLKKGETDCSAEYEYSPSFAGEQVIWKVFMDLDCNFGEPVVSSCSFGKPEVTVMIEGCTDRNYYNWNPNANVDDGSCVQKVYGCIHSLALNYNPLANVDNGTCIMPVMGCTDPNAINYNPTANVDDASCIAKIPGCTDPTAVNYDPNANFNDGSCETRVNGCTDINSINYNPLANYDNGSCIPKVFGCTDPTALNYNTNANTDNGTCLYTVPGCMDPTAINYNPGATVDNNSCQYASCHYGIGQAIITEGTLIVDDKTEINIFFDASGSMNSTLPKLLAMRETVLKPCLMPFFNNEGYTYDQRVRVFGAEYDAFSGTITNTIWIDERFMGDPGRVYYNKVQPSGLRTEGTDGTITKVINLVFQDEAHDLYHKSTGVFNPETEPPSETFSADIAALRTLYQSKSPDYFRSVMFQVKPSSSTNSAFKRFLQAIEKGQGLYTGANNLTDLSDQIKIKYDISGGASPEYYAGVIVSALNELGYSIPSC